MPKKITDNQLTELYLSFARDYRAMVQESYTTDVIYQNLYSRLYYSLNDPFSSLYDLDNTEQAKAWNVLNTFFSSCPQYRALPNPNERTNFFKKEIILINIGNSPACYCSRNMVFDWLLLATFMNHSSYGDGFGSSHTHSHSSIFDCNNESAAFLLLLILGLIAAAATLVALYYMLMESLHSIERFIYDEGWLQASITLASMLGGAVAGGAFGIFVAVMPLISLALAAGISNPIGIAIAGLVSLAVIGAGLTCYLTNLLQNKLIQITNKDAIDPLDPHRFTVTKMEENSLLANNLDPVKVKCAIIALREKIGEEPVPSLMNRLFTTSGGRKQDYLKQIRQLRAGELSQIQVDDMIFDLSQPQPYYIPTYLNASSTASNHHSHFSMPSGQNNSHYVVPLANFFPDAPSVLSSDYSPMFNNGSFA